MEIVTREQAIEQGLKRYFTGTPCKYGHTADRNVIDRSCAECGRLRSLANRNKDPGKARRSCIEAELRLKETNYESWKEKRKDLRQRVKHKHGPILYMFGAIKGRAKRKGQEFTITKNDIVIPDVCPALNIPLIFSDECTDNSPTLDRIDNSKGYIPGNIHVISSRANRIKNDSTLDELESIVKYLKTLTK